MVTQHMPNMNHFLLVIIQHLDFNQPEKSKTACSKRTSIRFPACGEEIMNMCFQQGPSVKIVVYSTTGIAHRFTQTDTFEHTAGFKVTGRFYL